MTIILRSALFLISFTTRRALRKPWASQGLAPMTTRRSQSSTPSAVWTVCEPNIFPFTQKSPVFSWDRALKYRVEPIQASSDRM